MRHGVLAKENYGPFFEFANDAILVHAIDGGQILDVNRKMCEMYGYTRDQALTLNPGALSAGTTPYTQEDALDRLRKAAAGQPQIFEWLAKDRSSRLFWVEMRLQRAAVGARECILAIVRDISGSKNVEEALKHKVEFGKLITNISMHFINLPFDRIDDEATCALRAVGQFASVDRSYIFQLDTDGDKMDNTHEWCAEEIQPQIGRLKRLSVRDFSWFMGQLEKGKVCYVARVAESPPVAAFEKAEWESEGIQSLICVPMRVRGRLIGFAGFDSVRKEKTWDEDEIALLKIVGEIFSNALDRKRTEEALRESESRYRLLSESLEEKITRKVAELQQARSLASIGEMVSVVAHEVRNPLQAIRMGLDVLHAEMKEDQKRVEVLTEIDYGVDLLNNIIAELLDYSRPVELRYSFRSVRALVEDSLKVLSHKLHNIDVTLALDDEQREILVDITKFTAVIVNLISNAIEAMPRGGSLQIRSRFCRDDNSNVLKLSITDTGCGIAEEHLKRVQEPFITTKTRGTGLGLPICRKLTEAHKGKMEIRSILNQGTTVEITIPA